jgi:hypothetical protein
VSERERATNAIDWRTMTNWWSAAFHRGRGFGGWQIRSRSSAQAKRGQIGPSETETRGRGIKFCMGDEDANEIEKERP